jgi:hypothetical protein
VCLDIREHGSNPAHDGIAITLAFGMACRLLGWNVVTVLYPVLLCIDLQIASLLSLCILILVV